ncbi:Protein of unknown functionlike protein [Hapsidospora chrysogenum ATCC 11550]|uniref:UNC93-like protein-like protein n=1 Tax=Hapsidospora chrysogenum (strain ATCC 11550 / CBS 779.69 / DSM 880 / IAM 14645 / JCM 23072 / IMI 49137) TaxID=857340 RepID=A0A086SX87_HAPC1|nr:Protein of unknown functionlike protein [Hapsidospora chrysogenum ATCC 11550]
MADESKGTAPTEVARDSADNSSHGYVDRPSGWIYKGFRLGGSELWYASPTVQLLMVSFVCFLCPGMFNALSGLGGGGQLDLTAQRYSNTALYGVFAVVGFFAGTVANRLGLRMTFAFGGLGYCLYAASFLSYNHNQNLGFVVFAGAFLGLCAGLLWTAQGAVMMAYPTEDLKGRFISWFWIIFNCGGVLGSLIPLGQNIHKTTPSSVSDGTYVGFIVLMTVGLVLGFCMVNADRVIREDGTKVILMKNPSWKTEFIGLWETLFQDPWIVLLFPMFFVSNIFYTYQNNGLNGTFFNIRTRSLNGLLYWLAQILGALVVGYSLDYTRFSRSVRAKASFVILTVLTMAIWGGGYVWQKKQVDRSIAKTPEWQAENLIDWTDGNELFLGPMFLYFFYGFFDAVWQTSIYWYMGALSNNGRKAANLAGFYKGLQSAGACVWWGLDADGMSYDLMFAVVWGLLGASLVIGAPVIFLRIKDTVEMEEDLKFSDETVEDVVVGAGTTKGEQRA